MIAFNGKVDYEERDICIEEECLKKNLNLCGLKMFLEAHGATIKAPIEYCQEVKEK